MTPTDCSKIVRVPRKRGRPARDAIGVVEAAVTVFAREGYAAATIEMIAAEASASTATLYKLFTNKQGLFVAVLQKTTKKLFDIHFNNRCYLKHEFSGIINRLECHALVCSDHEVRGVVRAWVGEVRGHSELSELFAIQSGRDLAEGLVKQLHQLTDDGHLAFSDTDLKDPHFAAQVMLGVVERFTLVRGLILGDDTKPIFSARGIAETAVQTMIGIWGTPKGVAAFAALPKADLHYQHAP